MEPKSPDPIPSPTNTAHRVLPRIKREMHVTCLEQMQGKRSINVGHGLSQGQARLVQGRAVQNVFFFF